MKQVERAMKAGSPALAMEMLAPCSPHISLYEEGKMLLEYPLIEPVKLNKPSGLALLEHFKQRRFMRAFFELEKAGWRKTDSFETVTVVEFWSRETRTTENEE